MLIAILVASGIWFVVAGVLFFNPIVDKIYRTQEKEPGVRALPASGKTIGMILTAIIIQVVLWAWVYSLVKTSLPGDLLHKGLLFGLVLSVTKMIPRDIDRMLLTKYPQKRMVIEFIIGTISCLAVGITFGYLIK